MSCFVRELVLRPCATESENTIPFLSRMAFLRLSATKLIKNTCLSRCSKLIAYMNLIKKVMLSNASTPSFGLYAQLSSVV